MTLDNESTIDVDEPKLTYERILNDLSDITKTDSVTSSCLHSRLFAIGTQQGRIHIFDHQGNKVNRQELCFHLKPIDCISIDERGEYLASSSSDRLVVYGLCDGKSYFNTMPDKPINVVAIDPYFHKPDGGRRFVTGDDRLVFFEKGLLTRHKSTVLQTKDQRPIRTVSWYGQFIAWATDTSAQVFDVDQRAIITRMKLESDKAMTSWDNVCQFSWKDKRTLLIGWCNTIKVCVIKDRSREMINESQLRELPKKYVEIISMFETDFPILGLAPFNQSLFTLSIHYPDSMPQKKDLSYIQDTQSISGLSMNSHHSTGTSIAGQSQVFFNNETSNYSNEQSINSNVQSSFDNTTTSANDTNQSSSRSFIQEDMDTIQGDRIPSPSESTLSSIQSSSLMNNSNFQCSDTSPIRPRIHIIETFPNTYNELSKDILTPNCCITVRDYLARHHEETQRDKYTKNIKYSTSSKSRRHPVVTKKSPYSLLSLHEEGIYFIVCAKDIISARPRDHDDHIDWLIQHSNMREAYEFACQYPNNLCRYTVRELEETYMRQLIDQNTHEGFLKAAKLCSSFCGQDLKSWDDAIKQFCDLGKLKYLIPYLPKGLGDHQFHLTKETYNMILQEFLRNDSMSFFKTIKELPSELYSLQQMTDQVIRKLANDPKDLVLNEALAELYTSVGNFEDAVNIYLDYNDKNRIFSLIRENNLVSILRDRVDRLMQIDANETSKLLVENVDYIPMRDIVERLENYKSKRFLVSYLHRLILRDPDSCIEYHDLMVRLYAQYQPESLLNFLKTSTNYSLEEALIICKDANLIKEVVHLLGRMGDLRIALKYIVESQGVHEAIDFCKEHQDSDLWQDLIVYSMDKPEYVSALLKNIGTHIDDPSDLIDRIPNGCEIEGLMPALVKILQDYQLQISLEKCCRDLMSKDCYTLLEKQIRAQTQGIVVREDQLCDHCNQPLLGDQSASSNVLDNLSQARSIQSAGSNSNNNAPNNNNNVISQPSGSSASNPIIRNNSIMMASSQLNDLVVFGCHHVFHEECCAIASFQAETSAAGNRKQQQQQLNKVRQQRLRNSSGYSEELGGNDGMMLDNNNDDVDDDDPNSSKILSCRVCMLEKDDDSSL